MGTSFWRNTYADLAEKAILDLGVAGIYMDQACSNLACYDPSHGHPLGGGNYWIEGFQALEEDIRRRCDGVAAIALAGEGCGEAWLPHLDLMLSLQVSLERYNKPGTWYPIPLFNAVYHDMATQYGNYSSLTRPPYDSLWPEEFAPEVPLALLDKKFATQFRMEQARSFLWGQQLCLANFREVQLTKRTDEIDFLVHLAKMRQRALKYFRDGEFLRPPEIEAPSKTIPISRLSIYAGQHDAVQEYTKAVPAVLASAWRSEEGSVAVTLVNISDEVVAIGHTLTMDEYPIPPAGSLYRIDLAGRTKLGAYSGGSPRLSTALKPHSVEVFEIMP
jgi:hypothetical protein